MIQRNPVLSIAALASVAIALLQGVASGDVNSWGEWAAVAFPIVTGFVQRAFVTPVADPRV